MTDENEIFEIFLALIKSMNMLSDFSDFSVFEELDQKIAPLALPTNCMCQHNNTSISEGITECLDCGEQLKISLIEESKMFVSTDNRSINDGNRCWAPKKKMKGIYEDVKGMGFPDPIVSVADGIFQKVTNGSIFRVAKRKAIIVACLMEAYKLEKQNISLEFILSRIPVSNITMGTKIVETKIKKYDVERNRSTYTSPEDNIRDIMSKWNDDPFVVEAVIELFRKVDDKSSLLNRSRTKSVAAAIVYYYALSTKRKNINLKEYALRVELSESTIQKLAKEISAVLDTPHILAY